MGDVPDFLPSESAFGFVNSWPSAPVTVLRTPFGAVRGGDASRGLCGGMVFAALDYWHAGRPVPAQRPDQGEPLYAFIVRRLLASWNLPQGIVKYYRWMRLPDAGKGGVGWRTVTRTLPDIDAALAVGRPLPLGVVTVQSRRLRDLRRNHQVLVYARESSQDRATLRVYDPNRGARDDIAISFDTDQAAAHTIFEHNLGLDEQVRGFFPIAYATVRPPPP